MCLLMQKVSLLSKTETLHLAEISPPLCASLHKIMALTLTLDTYSLLCQ